MKEWFSSAELSTIKGMPNTASNVTRKAKKENWESRQKAGVKGISYEYHIDSLPDDVQKDLLKAYTEPEKDTPYQNVSSEEIPVYDIAASAGNGCVPCLYEEPIGHMGIQLDMLRIMGISSANSLFVMPVSGDSMEPTLYDGDMILVKKLTDNFLLIDGVYVLRLGDSVKVKRIQYNKINHTLIIKSDNHYLYRDEVIEGDNLIQCEKDNQIQVIGEVLRVLMAKIRKPSKQYDMTEA
ncbi:helix-turn-helix domain-containing protein [Photobacterium damselae]|uniref:helix-turn-helix domain-containing protein n=1 Tax=Photobacterium damselae TaxID=38293 RepID=UPI000D66519C|nr:DNA-binding protein [Photobacterium damselae]AWK84506.1 hypothetical protein BST98_20960 [Photobacterium damselae]